MRGEAQIAVDTRVTFQVIDGFGSSQRLFDDPHTIGGPDSSYDRSTGLVMTIAQQDEVLDRLYVDLGLTRVRPGIYPVQLQPAKDHPFLFEWKRNDGFFDYVKRAKARGLTTWWLSPGNLERWMTEANPEEYVEWAMTVISRWRDHGLELPYYSVVNEPGYQRSGGWSGEYLRRVIKLLGPKLRAEHFNTKIVVPDEFNATEAHRRSQVILADPEARRYVAALAFHLYEEPLDNAAKMKQISGQYRIPLWMTEYSDDDPFTWANTMHELISSYEVSAIDYMLGFAGGGNVLVMLKHAGTRYLGYERTKHYYVMGQFSRFVKPGSQRVEVRTTDDALKVTAYTREQDLVIVAINNARSERTVAFTLHGLPEITRVQAIRTSMGENWRVLDPILTGGSTFTARSPSISVTTFIATWRD